MNMTKKELANKILGELQHKNPKLNLIPDNLFGQSLFEQNRIQLSFQLLGNPTTGYHIKIFSFNNLSKMYFYRDGVQKQNGLRRKLMQQLIEILPKYNFKSIFEDNIIDKKFYTKIGFKPDKDIFRALIGIEPNWRYKL